MMPTLNPYQPPVPIGEQDDWWSRLKRWFARLRQSERWMVEGIVFYCQIGDARRLYAACPSTADTEERLSLVVDEVKRLLPQLLRRDLRFRSSCRGRRIWVRLIRSYDAAPYEFTRQCVLPEEFLAEMLSKLPQDDGRSP